MSTPLLDTIHSPADLRKLSPKSLPALAEELRKELIDVVSRTGGHLGAGLGVIELTLALHYVFHTPDDRLVWDVGHQTYPHKILTGRRDRMNSLRKENGLSGFCKREESEYDVFGAGHSSTSISAALGLAVARDQKKENHEVVAIIGDGAMSAGMAYEALNNAGALKSRLFVILNDNEMSIAPAVGAMSNHLSHLSTSKTYHQFRDFSRHVAEHLPGPFRNAARRAERYARGVGVGGGSIFEELGFYYIGPLDGHDLGNLIPILQSAKELEFDKPVLLHVVTQKGKGFAPAENNHEKYHGVSCFDPDSGKQQKATASAPSYTKVFADSLIAEAQKDERVIAITAAMPSGTGLNAFAEQFPQRCFDVGIAEQHAVTFAAGLAMEGLKPFTAIYSTFLQRAYDQVVHDVAIQKLPVRFAIDRAGLVGADGPTHAGMFDVAFLSNLPHMVVMAAGDEAELVQMVHTAAHYDESPIAFRFPRGEGRGIQLPSAPAMLEIGKGRIVSEEGEARVAILNFGGRLDACIRAGLALVEEGIPLTLADARFAKPLDISLINLLTYNHRYIIMIEEGVTGGFTSQVLHYLALHQPEVIHRFYPLTLPDKFQHHAAPEAMYAEAGMDALSIARLVKKLHECA